VNVLSRETVWTVVFTAICSAFLACVGYLLTSISELQRRDATRVAVEFSITDAAELQQKLTDVMGDIDLRLSLMERDLEWVKLLPTRHDKPATSPPVPIPADPTPDWAPADEAPAALPPEDVRTRNAPSPRYDFRQSNLQERK